MPEQTEENKVVELEVKPVDTSADDSTKKTTKTEEVKKEEDTSGDNINDFLKLTDKVLEEPKEEEVKKEEVKKQETKLPEKEVEVKKTEETKKEDSRDYSGVDDTVVPLLKRMSNEAFKYFKPLVTEHQKVKNELVEKTNKIAELEKGIVKLPDNYYEHPNGFILSPEYEKNADVLMKAEVIADHWEKQFDKLRKGEDTYQSIEINPKTGELYLTKPIPIDANSEREILQYVRGAQTQLAKKQIDVQTLAKTHKDTYKKAVDEVKDFENKSFANFNKAIGKDAEDLQAMVNDTIKKALPAAFHNNPLSPGYAKALITIRHLATLLKEKTSTISADETKKEEVKKTTVVDEDQRRAGPTGSHLNGDAGGDGKKKDEEIGNDISDFESLKR